MAMVFEMKEQGEPIMLLHSHSELYAGVPETPSSISPCTSTRHLFGGKCVFSISVDMNELRVKYRLLLYKPRSKNRA